MQNYIEDWIFIATRYGAIFDNIEFVYENGTYKAKAIDRRQESILEIGIPILLPVGVIEITDNLHRVRKNFDLPPDLRSMINDYLAFILSDARLAELENLLDDFIQIPEELKKELSSFIDVELFKNLNRRALKLKLIRARTIVMNGQRVFMPFIDFLNHSFEEGIGFKINKDSISIRGHASSSNEIFSIYARMPDAFFFMQKYLFSPAAINAQSMNISIRVDEHTQLVIGRESNKMNMTANWLMEQEYEMSRDKIKLPIMWIGSHDIPRNPFWSFKKLWEGKLHRNDTHRIYSIIKSINISKLITILKLCNKFEENQAIRMVKESTLQQLTIIGEGYEEVVDISELNHAITTVKDSAIQQLTFADNEEV